MRRVSLWVVWGVVGSGLVILGCLVVTIGGQSVRSVGPAALLAEAPEFPTAVIYPGGREPWGLSAVRSTAAERAWCTALAPVSEFGRDCVAQSIQAHDNAVQAWWAFRWARPSPFPERSDRVPQPEPLSTAADEEELWCAASRSGLGSGYPGRYCVLWGWIGRYGQYVVTIDFEHHLGASYDTFAEVVRAIDAFVTVALGMTES